MGEKTHFEAFVNHITSDDIREISKIRAERDYALHCLEREIAICSQTQARNDVLVKALQAIAGWRTINLSAEHEHGLRDIIKSITDLAVAALETIKDERA